MSDEPLDDLVEDTDEPLVVEDVFMQRVAEAEEPPSDVWDTRGY